MIRFYMGEKCSWERSSHFNRPVPPHSFVLGNRGKTSLTQKQLCNKLWSHLEISWVKSGCKILQHVNCIRYQIAIICLCQTSMFHLCEHLVVGENIKYHRLDNQEAYLRNWDFTRNATNLEKNKQGQKAKVQKKIKMNSVLNEIFLFPRKKWNFWKK